MATRVEVQCSKKSSNQIVGIGGLNPDGTRWFMLEAAAILSIEEGKYSFFVRKGGKEVSVIVASRDGKKYLKTESDGIVPNNLLSLPDCPG